MNFDNIIQLKDVEFSYPAQAEAGAPLRALDGISLDIERGSFIAIVGSNGSGKSTLAKHFNALLLPSGGQVFVCGMNTSDSDCTWEIRRRCGMVFQNPDNQLVSSVVEDDVAFGPENIGMEPLRIRELVDESLKAVGMYEHRKRGPHLLSGGQKQRVAIAGVLAMQPECIVFDEPTAMLDPAGRRDILGIIKSLHEDGKTVVLITHFMEEAALAERVIVLDNGKLAFDEAPEKLFDRIGELEKYKLEPPFAASMAQKLRVLGLKIPEGTVTQEGLVNFLCR